MNKEVYDFIRRIDNKEEKIKKIIENNHLLSALERYQLVEEFDDKEILRLLKVLNMSLNSFSLQSLIGLLKADENVLEAFLLAKDNMELNDITMLINRMQSPVIKLRMIEVCKNQLTVYSFINLITSTKNIDIGEKIIEIWGICPEKDHLVKIFDQLQDGEIKKRFAEAFLKNRDIALQKIQEVQKKGYVEESVEVSNLPENIELEIERVEPRDEIKFQPSFIYKDVGKITSIVPGYLQEDAWKAIVNMTMEHDAEKNVMEC